MKQALRVVLDTNVAVSALVFRDGILASLRLAWQSGRVEPLVDRATAGELVRVLAYPKFRLTEAERETLLADYLPWCRVVALPRRPPAVPACKDADDVAFLRLAITGKADYLVTGDRALASLAGRFVCPILSAAELLRHIGPGMGRGG
ncbi:MAG: putative toxin-antitoxin system toxin component, PIN family [Lysobacter sp.]|nr:putative toxin-antitoxin system toxin component, PIN family [Lysobacter sp.]